MRFIQIVHKSNIKETKKILSQYLIELSEFDPDIKFDKNGTPIYKWFDCYWTDKERYPIYLIVDNEVAGLAFIRELGNKSFEMAEFYIKPEFRKDGNAIWFATEITNLFDGRFEISTRFTNPRAINFWSKFVVQFENSYIDDDIWRNWKIK